LAEQELPMLFLSLLLAAQAVPQALLDDADAASLAHVGCLFATYRQANEAGLSVAQFENKLARSCAAESQALRQASARIFTRRGQRDPAAEAERMVQDSRRGMVEQYRRQPEIDKQLKQLGELCRANPEACGQ
jgi:hypothetical protein